jgi:hypothetical protein
MDDEERRNLERLVHSLETDVCQAWRDTFHERENRNWGLDDPVDELDTIRAWEAVIHDLEPDTVVTVKTGEGVSVLEATTSANGVAQFSTMFEGEDSPTSLVLERSGARDKVGVITTRQTTFVRRNSFAVEGDVSAMDFTMGANGAKLLAITDAARTSTWDVSNAQAPVFLGSTPLAALDGGGFVALGNMTTPRLPRFAGAKLTDLAVDGTKSILRDVTDPAAPKALVTYNGKPWFDGVSASGKLLAKVRPDKNRVDLYFATSTGRDADLYKPPADNLDT